ncbi:MAG: hypothetical protein UY96_C0017G0057 [Parcubacteria group bacterium GW2011_GWB1_56_8]|nr:MAG: hypothetical protein UY96_C0017G0057 [Parcubacteria group bacterium GW2011_GWB1_56_8]
MQLYLAARYSRRLELCKYRDELRAMGHVVQATWLDGQHQVSDTGAPLGNEGESLVEDDSSGDKAARLREKFALDDFDEVFDCDMLIAFTEPPRSAPNRGGRHVEMGIALGRGIPVVIVGSRENIFCWLPQVRYFYDWRDVKGWLERIAEDRRVPT